MLTRSEDPMTVTQTPDRIQPRPHPNVKPSKHHFFFGGGGGGGLVACTSPDEAFTESTGLDLGAGGLPDGLDSLDMEQEIWNLRARAHFNVHYWALMRTLLAQWDVAFKILFGLGTVSAFLVLASSPALVLLAAMMALVCSGLGCVILPAIGWDALPGKVEKIQCRWEDARTQADALWADCASGRQPSTRSIKALRSTFGSISKENIWLPDIQKYRHRATDMRDASLQA